jgi:hypothetical protein
MDASSEEEFALLRPIRGELRASRLELFEGQRWRLATREDHLDNVRREESESQCSANVRDLLAISGSDLGNRGGTTGAEIIKPAVGIGDEADQAWIC